MNTQADIKKFIADNIGRHKFFTLGTVDEAGAPWVACLTLAYDDRFNIIWKSLKTTAHSTYLRARPDVAICIFSDTPEVGNFGLYIKAKAREITSEEELERLLPFRAVVLGKPMPSVAEFTGDAPGRLYYAEITEAWINDDSHTKQTVDLNVLRGKS